MTEIENTIDRFASECLGEVPGQEAVHFPPCQLIEKLQAAFAKSSENELLSAFLEKNYFKCTKVGNETRCHNVFNRILKPATLPFARKNTNPGYEETYTTDVAFEQTKPGPLAAQDIKVKFTRLIGSVHS